LRTIILLILILLCSRTIRAEEKSCQSKLWTVTGFIGQGATRGIEKVIEKRDFHLKSTFFGSVALARQCCEWRNVLFFERLILEVEGQAAKHWGRQHNGELTLAPILRFNDVGWPDVICMNFAIGDGISQTIGTPKVEPHPKKTLNFLLLEGAFFRPQNPDWQVVLRLHHRCKCWGLYSSKRGAGTNFIALGLRYRFG
jgi:hypothetical protein